MTHRTLAQLLAQALLLASIALAACVDRELRAAASKPSTAMSDSSQNAVLDGCAPVAMRPMRRFRDYKPRCTPERDPADVARAQWVLLGTAWDVSEAQSSGPPPPRCGGPYTHTNNADYIRAVRALRPEASSKPISFVHLHRFEIVTLGFTALPGFDASFLLRTRRPYSEVEDFFRRDRTAPCQPRGCRWSDSILGDPRREGGLRLRDRIDASAEGAPVHPSVIYYLSRSSPGQTLFWPRAVLADLGNPAYRAWRVREARRALELGGYDAVMLNQKFPQWRRRGGHWIGSPDASNVRELNELRDTLFSAPPEGYGYSEYVQGWAALAADLRAGGVPYMIWISPSALVSAAYDDPATAHVDEGALIREVARHAYGVLLKYVPVLQASRTAAAAEELRKAGVSVVTMQPTALPCL